MGNFCNRYIAFTTDISFSYGCQGAQHICRYTKVSDIRQLCYYGSKQNCWIQWEIGGTSTSPAKLVWNHRKPTSTIPSASKFPWLMSHAADLEAVHRLGMKRRASKVGAKLGPAWPQLGSSWPQLDPTLAQVGPKLTQVGAKLSPSWPHFAQVRPPWLKLAQS